MDNLYENAKAILTDSNFNKLNQEQIREIYRHILSTGITKEQISEIIRLKYFNLYHTTSLEGLYVILQSGYLKSRNSTGVKVGFSPELHKESGDWIYFGLNSELPPPGRLSVQLVFSSKLLEDRKDYWLNSEWSYGKTERSLAPENLNEFLKNKGPSAEIIFENEVPLDPYLIQINVIQLPNNLIQTIPIQYRPQTINFDEIPPKYKNLVKIIEKAF